ncbi:hypothetical protein [Aquamicrobium sp. LC103]|uniref:hypothetical protein n=1 Tax=Aquamicrobium sp. LC103 TaxID=1120658 RepID=UPI00063ECA9A|nr:hypothetical protein [Aquamicrobium sp. LC103]TKT81167.1 hypothetical protein XW59_004650 [Aquamicrobium sp. LC103]
MAENDVGQLASELHSALTEFHRALIRAEAGDDPDLQNPYTLLFAVINDPRFSWLGPLSQLIVRMDEVKAEGGLSTVESLVPFGEAAAQFLGEGADGHAEFRLRYLIAVQRDPQVGLAAGALRRAVSKLPSAKR